MRPERFDRCAEVLCSVKPVHLEKLAYKQYYFRIKYLTIVKSGN